MNLENKLLENQLLEKFQVEELEKRLEFSGPLDWIVPHDPNEVGGIITVITGSGG
ncbi:hypothetical protein [Flavobacterium undicola]|uniref:hypothetical protein n=1 Tax=Flavobacterium undicola TaxID=1932779 RepID=UPI0013789C09|nr:hypothetical protein [Flavobacterium undicola]MBA0884765.1 hypothetical protein [Flavobacterium undicola]